MQWRAWWRSPTFWTAVFVVLGLGLRTYHYARNPSVWHDEAALLVNVLHKGFGDLLGPLELAEAGPPLFLWAERAISLTLGESTYAMRLLPFLASCIALVLLVPLARRLLRPEVVPCVVLLFACSNRLLWHSCEAKPYATDVLAATLVASLFFFSESWKPHARILMFAALAPLIILASYPGCFIYGAVLLALLPAAKRDGEWLSFGLLVAVVVVSFVGLYGPAQSQRCDEMTRCWLTHFPDWTHFWTVPVWMVCSTLDVIRYSLEPAGHVLGMVAGLGAICMWRSGRRTMALFLVAPAGLALLAGCLRAYPYGGSRLEVFTLTATVLLFGAGLPPLWSWLRSRAKVGAIAMAGAVLAIPGLSLYRIAVPWPRADCGGAAAFVLKERQASEGITANHWEYLYYFRHLGSAFVPLDKVAAVPVRNQWLILTNPDNRDQARLGKYFAPQDWCIVDQHAFASTTVYRLERRAEETTLVSPRAARYSDNGE